MAFDPVIQNSIYMRCDWQKIEMRCQINIETGFANNVNGILWLAQLSMGELYENFWIGTSATTWGSFGFWSLNPPHSLHRSARRNIVIERRYWEGLKWQSHSYQWSTAIFYSFHIVFMRNLQDARETLLGCTHVTLKASPSYRSEGIQKVYRKSPDILHEHWNYQSLEPFDLHITCYITAFWKLQVSWEDPWTTSIRACHCRKLLFLPNFSLRPIEMVVLLGSKAVKGFHISLSTANFSSLCLLNWMNIINSRV